MISHHLSIHEVKKFGVSPISADRTKGGNRYYSRVLEITLENNIKTTITLFSDVKIDLERINID